MRPHRECPWRDERERERIKRAFLAGYDAEQVAARWRVQPGTAREWKRKLGLSLPRKLRCRVDWRGVASVELQQGAMTGRTATEIATRIASRTGRPCTRDAVLGKARRTGLKLKGRGGARSGPRRLLSTRKPISYVVGARA